MNTVLTDEEINAMAVACTAFSDVADHFVLEQESFARAIEAAVLAKFGEPVATYEGHFKTLDVGIAKEHCSIPEGTPLYAIRARKDKQ